LNSIAAVKLVRSKLTPEGVACRPARVRAS
jgi:hypothetical protein